MKMNKKKLLNGLVAVTAATLLFAGCKKNNTIETGDTTPRAVVANAPITVCYVEVNSNNILNVGNYTLQNSKKQLFDIAIIFAANINYNVSTKKAVLGFNENVTKVLNGKTTYIKPLQDKGIKVLLSILGNHQGAGFCNFTSQAAAKEFAQQLANAVTTYGLDGIDFDDEYADYGTNGTTQPNASSFVLLVQELRKLMPSKLITFYNYGPAASRVEWNGLRVGDNANYSWNASYGTFSVPNVPPMGKAKLGPAAVWINNTSSSTAKSLAQSTKNGGYGVYLTYDLPGTNVATYLSSFSSVLYGENAVLSSPLKSWP